jgi:hypothetical protein
MSTHSHQPVQLELISRRFTSHDLTRADDFGTNYDLTHEDISLDSNVPYRIILSIILLSNLWTLVLTVLPALLSVSPDNYYAHHPHWYTGDDVIRFIEPIGGIVWNFWIFYKSGILQKEEKSIDRYSFIAIFGFFIGIGIYSQGAGLHSAATMFKNAVETLPSFSSSSPEADDKIDDLYFYLQTVWEHQVSHYLYAIGLALIHASQAYVYRNVKAPQLGLTRIGKILLFCSSLLLGLLVAGVSIEFPSGIIVGLIYIVLYGIGGIGGFLLLQHRRQVEDKSLELSFGHRPVLHHFFFGYVWALLILIAWIIAVDGFKSRNQASLGI